MFEVEIKNVEHDDEIERYAECSLKRVAEIAPFDATCHATIEGFPFGVHAKLRVDSRGQRFEGDGFADQYQKAIDIAEAQVERELERHLMPAVQAS